MKKIAVSLAIILLASGINPSWGASPASDTKAENPKPAEAPARSVKYRGLTVRLLDETTLREAREKWGANIVRIQFPMDYLVKNYNLSWEDAWKKNLEDIDRGLDIANKYGLTVVLTMPFMGAEQYDRNASRWANLERLWDNDVNLDHMKMRWHEIAVVAAKKNTAVWYDLLNEPLDRRDWPKAPKKWPVWSQALIDEIRKVDKKNWIVVEPGPGGEMWEGIKHFPRLKDDKLIYSVHFYAPQKYTHQGVHDTQHTDSVAPIMEVQKPWPGEYTDSWGNGYWDKARLLSVLQPAIEFSKKNPDIRIYMGEFSVARWAPNGADYLKDCLEIFESLGWDWTYHALRESPIWSLDHTAEYSLDKPRLSETITDRGTVVKSFLNRNALKVGSAP